MERFNIAEGVVRHAIRRESRNADYLYFMDEVDRYLAWYRGRTDWHVYFVPNGKRRKRCERVSLNMAKTICEDKANLIVNEKLEITCNESSQATVDKVLKKNNFTVQSSQLSELVNALGSGAYVAGWNGGKTVIDYIHGDMVFPLSWENGNIIECAFGAYERADDKKVFSLIMHLLEDGKYVIKTIDLDYAGNELKREVLETGSDIPLFSFLRTNIVNNIDKTSPLGISCFANAIDILKNIDAIYDSWLNEFILGKKRIFVKSDLRSVVIDKQDERIKDNIDPNDVLFYQLEWDGDNLPIKETNMEIRDESHIRSLDAQLKLLSRAVGLGEEFYQFTGGNAARTATEVISTNSALYKSIRKEELIWEDAIIKLVRAILFLENKYNGGTHDLEQDITVDFDDSIIEDDGAVRKAAMEEYNAGVIDRVEYFAITRRMTRKQAEKFIAEMDATDTMSQSLKMMNMGSGFLDG